MLTSYSITNECKRRNTSQFLIYTAEPQHNTPPLKERVGVHSILKMTLLGTEKHISVCKSLYLVFYSGFRLDNQVLCRIHDGGWRCGRSFFVHYIVFPPPASIPREELVSPPSSTLLSSCTVAGSALAL